MAEDGAHTGAHTTTGVSTDTPAPVPHNPGSRAAGDASMPPLAHQESPMSPRVHTPNPFSRKNTSLDLDDYFVSRGIRSQACVSPVNREMLQKGPRDIQRHSKWPLFLRMHGSILPKMILPLLAVGAWASAITVISMYRTFRKPTPLPDAPLRPIDDQD
jgi:hypothetical protein